MSDLPKKFQVASVYDKNAEYQNWSSCYNLFLSYVDNKLLSTGKKCDFRIQEISKRVNLPEFPFRKFDPQIVRSVPHMGNRK